LRERITVIRGELSRTEALRLAGQTANAAELAARAVGEARQTKNEPILAEALLASARAIERVDPGRAAREGTEAFWGAFASRLDRVAAAASILAVREYATINRFDDSALWEKYARAGLQRMGGDDELESELWTSLMFRAFEQQNRDEQVTTASRAARLAERRFGLDDLRTLNRQQNELTAFSNAYRVIEGWRLRGPLLQRQEALLGTHHPILARSLMDLGDDEVKIGHLADARAHLGRAEQLFRDAGETETLAWNALRLYQQNLAMTEGRIAETEALVRESLSLLDRMKILDTERALDQRLALARVQARRGQSAMAAAQLRRMVTETERNHGKDNGAVGEILSTLAGILNDAGQIAEAREAAERNLALVRRTTPDSAVAMADARMGLASVRVKEGRAAEALALVDESLPALLKSVGDMGPGVEQAHHVRGEALLVLGRFAEAATALQSALDIATRSGLDPVEREATRAALDRALARNVTPSKAPSTTR
jgi:tetratricopeptide (TPR) repeat protein